MNTKNRASPKCDEGLSFLNRFERKEPGGTIKIASAYSRTRKSCCLSLERAETATIDNNQPTREFGMLDFELID
jgi:hypothetical protein